MTPPKGSTELEELREQVHAMRAMMTTSASGAGDALARAIELQTEAIGIALRAKETRHSTIKVSPTFRWPSLGDEGPDSKEIEEFYDKYEDLRRPANDGRGVNPTEHLTTLLSCFKGSKVKIYKLIYKKHRKLGTLMSDPDGVFE